MHQSTAALHVAQELVAQAQALMRALQQAGHVCQGEISHKKSLMRAAALSAVAYTPLHVIPLPQIVTPTCKHGGAIVHLTHSKVGH